MTEPTLKRAQKNAAQPPRKRRLKRAQQDAEDDTFVQPQLFAHQQRAIEIMFARLDRSFVYDFDNYLDTLTIKIGHISSASSEPNERRVKTGTLKLKMGSGKTRIALGLIQQRLEWCIDVEPQRHLIIVPYSICRQWAQEIATFYSPQMRKNVAIINTSRDIDETEIEFQGCMVNKQLLESRIILMNKNLLTKHADRKNNFLRVRTVNYDLVFIDEEQLPDYGSIRANFFWLLSATTTLPGQEYTNSWLERIPNILLSKVYSNNLILLLHVNTSPSLY
jgi:SNF2 family DNA or RNA helicase